MGLGGQKNTPCCPVAPPPTKLMSSPLTIGAEVNAVNVPTPPGISVVRSPTRKGTGGKTGCGG
jgi:hypothetical protein